MPFSTPFRYYCSIIALLLCGSIGCSSLTKNAVRPCEIPVDAIPASRSKLVPIDHRFLGTPIEHEHRVVAGDVLGIYIADIVGKRDELPQVSYPSFRTKNAPIEPFVGLPFKVESDGTLHLPYTEAIQVEGLSIPEVRDAIIHTYVANRKLIKPGRDNVAVSLITPKYHRIYVVRQDTRYNVPGLQSSAEFEISRRWSGTTLYLEPKEASVLTALMTTGGLPGIDAMNEIWVMKGVPEPDLEIACLPIIEKLEGPAPMMLSKEDSKLVRIPLHHTIGEEFPFSSEDVVLGNGDVVFLPRRDGDTFMTGGMLPPGRYPLPRDRDLEILEAIAICTGSNFGPAQGSRSPSFKGGGGGLIPPTDVIIVRRLSATEQCKIFVDLNKCLDDPAERVRIAPGDLILLQFKRKEMAGNLALNLFNLNFTLSRVLGNGTAIVQ